jgi:hypothetical protein
MYLFCVPCTIPTAPAGTGGIQSWSKLLLCGSKSWRLKTRKMQRLHSWRLSWIGKMQAAQSGQTAGRSSQTTWVGAFSGGTSNKSTNHSRDSLTKRWHKFRAECQSLSRMRLLLLKWNHGWIVFERGATGCRALRP